MKNFYFDEEITKDDLFFIYTSAYYEPSYVLKRAYYAENFDGV